MIICIKQKGYHLSSTAMNACRQGDEKYRVAELITSAYNLVV